MTTQRSPAHRRTRTVIVLAVFAAFAATVWLLLDAAARDDLPWVVWKLEGPAERGTTALPVLRVAARPNGAPILGDWQSVVTARSIGSDGKVDRIWESLYRQRTPAWFWRWWSVRSGRPWMACYGRFSETAGVERAASGTWREFVRDPLPGDTWCRRPDPALVGHWSGWFVENWPHRSSSLELRADGSVDGLVEMPGTWGTDGEVLILSWGGGALGGGCWRGLRSGAARFKSLDRGLGSLQKQ